MRQKGNTELQEDYIEMVLINCHSCQLQIAKCSELRHMNNVHGPAGTMPKTAAELNEDEGPQAQRWRDCQWCGGHFIGIKQHVKKCPSRPAVAPAEPAAAAAAAAAPGGIGNAAENAGDAENAGQPVGDAENAGQPLEEAGNVGQQAGAGGNVGQQEGAAENVGQLAGAAGNVGQQMGDGRVAGANGNEIAGEEEEAVDYGRLVAEFNKGLYSPHHASIEYIKQIFIILLRQAVEDSVVRSVEAIVALQLIAGMVQFLKDNARRKVMKPQDMLRAIIASPNKATCIINLAKQFRKLKRVRGDQAPRQPNVEITRAEIEKLINDGRLSTARKRVGMMQKMILGEQIPQMISQEAMNERIPILFPRGDERDELPDEEEDPAIEECLQLNGHQIRERGSKLNTGSCAGSTGITFKLLSKILNDKQDEGHNADSPPGDIHNALAAFTNKVLQNKICPEGRELLTTVRLVMVPKDEGDGLRPLQIDCSLMRFMAGAAKKVSSPVIAPYLLPRQLGGSIKRGPEIVIRFIDQALAEGKSVIQIDSTNAFGLMRHRKIYNKLKDVIPSIVRFFRFKYGAGVIVRDSRGNIVTTRETGVGQGDPGAGDYYMLGADEMLREMETTLIAQEEEYRDFRHEVVEPGAVLAYYDDVYVAGDAPVINLFVDKIQPIYARHDAEVNVPKSAATGTHVEEWEGLPADWPTQEHGTLALGAYVGDPDWKKERIAAKVEKMAPPTNALVLLRNLSQMLLIKSCYNLLAAYTVATARNMEDIAEAANRFDTRIQREVTRIAQAELTPTIRSIITRPNRHGGFGILQTGGIEAEIAILTSRQYYIEFISKYQPNKLQYALDITFSTEILLGGSEGVEDLTEIDATDMATITVGNVRRILAGGKRKVYEGLEEQQYQELADDQRSMQHAAYLRSASGTNAAVVFITGTRGRGSEVYFADGEYQACLRRHLGLGPSNAEPAVRVCQCGEAYESEENKTHGTLCSINKGLRTKLHNQIVQTLCQLIRSMNPMAGAEDIKMEQDVGQIVTAGAQGGPEHVTLVRADIVFKKGPTKFVIDAAVVNPAAKEFLRHPVDSHMHQDRAAVKTEIRKRKHYGRSSRDTGGLPATIPAASVIPFVFESSGRLGPSALMFLNFICGTQTFRRSAFISDCAMICARYNGKMLVATRNRYNAAPQNGG